VTGISIKGVTVRYPGVTALDDVTLDVPAGEWLSIVGPNGAGKTTLLRAMAAAVPLTSGEIAISEEDGMPESVFGLPSRIRAQRLGVLPQDHNLPEGWSVREVVATGRAPWLGMWRNEGRADRKAVSEAMRLTDTLRFADREAHTLSGGERQRALLARVLAQTPKVLLLDEPTAFLDLQYQWEMLEIVEQARRERGITVVAVLHDLNLASAFSHRIAMMKGGRLAALGTPDEVLTEDITRNVYGRRVTIGRHPATGRPTVVSWPSETPGARNTAIHIISGGGTGAALIRRLNADGHAVTAGVLNIGDTDWETAQALDLDIAEEAPFSSVSEAAYTAAEALVRRASMVLVAPMPIGPGNLDNLRLAAEAAKRGQKVLLIGVMDESRDFTGGLAGPLWDDAVAHGAVVSPDVVSALNTALGIHSSDSPTSG
jgi:iron complex transport system ATP-binding protein